MKQSLLFLLVILSVQAFAQNDCGQIQRLEERLERLRLTCEAPIVKCKAGNSNGLGPDEAIRNCISSHWSDREGCIEHLKC